MGEVARIEQCVLSLGPQQVEIDVVVVQTDDWNELAAETAGERPCRDLSRTPVGRAVDPDDDPPWLGRPPTGPSDQHRAGGVVQRLDVVAAEGQRRQAAVPSDSDSDQGCADAGRSSKS